MHVSAPQNLDVGFTLVCSALVFFMQAGFCLLESGLVRTKNTINVAVKNVLDCLITMILFSLVGFHLMYGDSFRGLVGRIGTVDFWNDGKLVSFFLFQLVFCSTATTIVSGAVAERIRLSAYLFIVLVMSGFVYPVVGHWVWGGTLPGTQSGMLRNLGFVDWAGCSAVHVVGGFASLAAVYMVGRRRHLVHRDVTGGHSLTLAILGCFILWFGWWGFNGGSGMTVDARLPLVLVNTNLGAAAGGLAAVAWSLLSIQKVGVVPLISGILAGLVSVTASCHVISPLSATICGAIGAILCLSAEKLILRLKFDDVVSAFPVHGAAGLWGLVAYAIFVPSDQLGETSRMAQAGIQVGGGLAAGAFAFIVVLASLFVLRQFTRLRVKAGEELAGLNMVEHGATNEVVDLLVEMNQHRRTGDYSRQLTIDPFTEVGQIATEYNRVLEKIRDEIHQHHETNDWLQGERLRMQSVLEHAGVGIYQLDAEGKFLSANTTLLEILGQRSADTMIDTATDGWLPWHDLQSPSSQSFKKHFDEGSSIHNVESELLVRADSTVWVLESLVPIRDDRGCLLSWLGTMHDITERKQSMLAQVEVAEAKSRAKGEFLANMSHEIRTPLNGVIGMLDLLSNSKLPDVEDHYVKVARSSADSLLALVNDVLDFSKIEAGRLELENTSFDLRELIETTAEQFAFLAHQKKLEMNCQLSKDLPYMVNGDPERLRQVLINLLGNAIKFTHEGEVNLRVTQRGKMIRFVVQDTGIGMSDDVQQRLFQSFMQADASTTRQYGGTGLGLAISGRLVQMMGSQIHVTSSIDCGSEFRFDLALEIVESAATAESRTQLLVERLASTRVLVIDDNATNCEILTCQLQNWGMEVAVCRQSTTAVERMLVAHRIGKPFDLVILDFCMPEMNGTDVAMAMRREPALVEIPVLLLSSNYGLMTRAEQVSVGIQATMKKPARQSRLLDSMMKLLHRRHEVDGDKQVVASRADVAMQPTTSHRENTSSVPASRGMFLTKSNPTIADTHSSQADRAKHRFAADVLIVEDNQINQMVVRQMLTTLGLTSEIASNGQVALGMIQSHRFQLVLMDGHMPIMDGLTATRRVRDWESTSGTARVPIVALTANVVQGVREEAIEAGMDEYLSKPITLPRLKEIVEKFVDRNAATVSAMTIDVNQGLLASKDFATLIASPAPTTAVDPTLVGTTSPELSPTVQPALNGATTVTRKPHRKKTKPRVRIEALQSASELLCRHTLLDQCGGDEEFAREILQIMKDSLPIRLNELDTAQSDGDLPRVKSVAHQLKGAAGDTALKAVYAKAATLEERAAERDEEGCRRTLSILRSDIELTLDLLETLFDDSPQDAS